MRKWTILLNNVKLVLGSLNQFWSCDHSSEIILCFEDARISPLSNTKANNEPASFNGIIIYNWKISFSIFQIIELKFSLDFQHNIHWLYLKRQILSENSLYETKVCKLGAKLLEKLWICKKHKFGTSLKSPFFDQQIYFILPLFPQNFKHILFWKCDTDFIGLARNSYVSDSIDF